MKYFKILLFGLWILVCSCKQSSDNVSEKKIDDGVRLVALNNALQLAQKNISLKKFSSEFVLADSNMSVSTNVTAGTLFDEQTKHCMITRETPGTVYIDVYSLNAEGKQFEKVLAHEQLGLTYDSTFIQDVNGDKHNDVLVSWYGASGCDLKKFYVAYLYISNGKFTQEYQFVNPALGLEKE